MHTKEVPGLDVIIVLGAHVRGTAPSKSLRLRLERAKAYLDTNPETIAVLSGGRGEGELISEAFCMKEYLLKKGIAEERLLLEDRSTSTVENLRYSVRVLRKKTGQNLLGCKVGLVSNNFHIYRAVELAKKLGFQNVVGIPAKADLKRQPQYMTREYLAIVAAKLRGDL